MAVDRTIEHRDGSVERVTTTEPGGGSSGGSGAGAMVALIVGLLAVLVIGYFVINMSRNDDIQTNAVSNAAESVSGAAQNVGDAAQKAAESVPAPSN